MCVKFCLLVPIILLVVWWWIYLNQTHIVKVQKLLKEYEFIVEILSYIAYLHLENSREVCNHQFVA